VTKKDKFPPDWYRLAPKFQARIVKCHLWGPSDLLVLCPYCPAFTEAAKGLGGRFVKFVGSRRVRALWDRRLGRSRSRACPDPRRSCVQAR